MRQVADVERIRRFMREFGAQVTTEARVYFAGGATAVLFGWRPSTIDIDLKLVPDDDSLLRAIARMKEALQINVELASPIEFVPVPPGWEDRGLFIGQEGKLSFFHFDLYAQALAKVERGHTLDLEDVSEMISRGLVESARALEYFRGIEPELYRYPAIDPRSFRQAVEAAFS